MGVLIKSAVLAGELSGAELLVAKRDAFLGSAPQPGKWTGAGGFIYEVVGRQPDPKHPSVVEFFVKAWLPDGKRRLVFGPKKVGIERFRVANIPVLTDDPIGGTEQCGLDDKGVVILRPKLIEDSALVARAVIEHAVSITGIPDDGSGRLSDIGNTSTVIYSDTTDGVHTKSGTNATWASLHDAAASTNWAAANANVNCPQIATGPTSGWSSILRVGLPYSTDTLPDADVISAVVMSIYSNLKSNTLGGTHGIDAVSFAPANFASIVAGDYDTYGTDVYASVDHTAWVSSGAYNDFTFGAAGIAAINKTAKTGIGLRISDDTTNIEPGFIASKNVNVGIFFSDQAGTTNDPKITVTHAAAPSTGSNDKQNPRRYGKRWAYYGRC